MFTTMLFESTKYTLLGRRHQSLSSRNWMCPSEVPFVGLYLMRDRNTVIVVGAGIVGTATARACNASVMP